MFIARDGVTIIFFYLSFLSGFWRKGDFHTCLRLQSTNSWSLEIDIRVNVYVDEMKFCHPYEGLYPEYVLWRFPQEFLLLYENYSWSTVVSSGRCVKTTQRDIWFTFFLHRISFEIFFFLVSWKMIKFQSLMNFEEITHHSLILIFVGSFSSSFFLWGTFFLHTRGCFESIRLFIFW